MTENDKIKVKKDVLAKGMANVTLHIQKDNVYDEGKEEVRKASAVIAKDIFYQQNNYSSTIAICKKIDSTAEKIGIQEGIKVHLDPTEAKITIELDLSIITVEQSKEFWQILDASTILGGEAKNLGQRNELNNQIFNTLETAAGTYVQSYKANQENIFKNLNHSLIGEKTEVRNFSDFTKEAEEYLKQQVDINDELKKEMNKKFALEKAKNNKKKFGQTLVEEALKGTNEELIEALEDYHSDKINEDDMREKIYELELLTRYMNYIGIDNGLNIHNMITSAQSYSISGKENLEKHNLVNKDKAEKKIASESNIEAIANRITNEKEKYNLLQQKKLIALEEKNGNNTAISGATYSVLWARMIESLTNSDNKERKELGQKLEQTLRDNQYSGGNFKTEAFLNLLNFAKKVDPEEFKKVYEIFAISVEGMATVISKCVKDPTLLPEKVAIDSPTIILRAVIEELQKKKKKITNESILEQMKEFGLQNISEDNIEASSELIQEIIYEKEIKTEVLKALTSIVADKPDISTNDLKDQIIKQLSKDGKKIDRENINKFNDFIIEQAKIQSEHQKNKKTSEIYDITTEILNKNPDLGVDKNFDKLLNKVKEEYSQNSQSRKNPVENDLLIREEVNNAKESFKNEFKARKGIDVSPLHRGESI